MTISGLSTSSPAALPAAALERAAPGGSARRQAAPTGSPSDQEGPIAAERAREAEGPGGLTDEERRVVAELQRTDREVRSHEQAHLAAAGGLAQGVSFTYTTGPDGKQYAVAGEVSLDTSPESDPERTIQKAQQIRAAANAPANPSGQDRAVAAAASQMEAAARAELTQQEREEREAREQELTRAQAGAFEAAPGESLTGALINLAG